MADFLKYVFEEVKSNRLSEADAVELVLQFRAAAGRGWRAIHPLLQRNTSTLTTQRFSSIFTGEEFFLKDHVVQGQRILPGAAQLEMARAAVEQAVGGREAETEIRLEHVTFLRPIVIGAEPLEVHIALEPLPDGVISFEIYLEAAEEEVVCSQGRAAPAQRESTTVIDLQSVIEQCAEHSLDAAECYSEFARMALVYGPAFQSLERVRVGHNAAGLPLVVGELSLPQAAIDDRDSYVLHPSLLDGALQTSIGLKLNAEPAARPALPFAIERMDLLAPLPDKVWVVLSQSNDSQSAIQKLNIEIVDTQGRVCLRLKNFSRRVFESIPQDADIQTLILRPKWIHQPASLKSAHYHAHWVVLCGTAPGTEDEIKARMPGANCLRLNSDDTTPAAQYTSYATQLLEQVQAILASKPDGEVLFQLVVPVRGPAALLRGLSGLLKSAGQENPRLIGQTLAIAGDAHVVAEHVEAESRGVIAGDVRYTTGERQVLRLEEVTSEIEAAGWQWKDNAVHLITGGGGALGFTFAEAIAGQSRGAKLILTGRRSQLGEAEQARLDVLRSLGAEVEYRATDVSDSTAVASLIAHITQKYGPLSGVIHSAGLLRDGFILKKSPAELKEVFAPKVAGLVALDEATAELPLDYFVVFSSLTAVIGNVGQADYAAANGFMDAYAEYRNELVKAGQRRGHTLSVNWPLWDHGSMQVDAGARERMWRHVGLVALETKTGVHALSKALQLHASQVLVVAGDRTRISERLLDVQEHPRHDVPSIGPTIELSGDVLKDKTVRYLINLLADRLKLPVERIEAQAPLEEYGIDSVMIMELINVLERSFGPLSKTLFFEYQSIELLAGYFLQSHRAQLVELLGLTSTTSTPQTIPEPQPSAPAVAISRRSGQRFAPLQMPVQSTRPLDIAIIGLSGRYPGANRLEEYWANLTQGVNCVTEVPKDRWDHSQYFDEKRDTPGKSYSKWGGFINGVDQFDPLFFNIAPRAAMTMDPQERLFLQCAYAAIEDAGYTRESLARNHEQLGPGGNVGVFVGVMYEEYQLYGAQAQALGQGFALAGNISSIANRVSYFCNFHGPSLAVDTMCSSSLTAIHLACQNLTLGTCEVAIAGGVNLTVHPNKYVALGQGQFISSDGQCRSFGEGGDGYVPGEGVGAVLLKPLRQAIADGDHIYGVIKGSALNHGGKTNGYTVPNPKAQAEVIREALQESGIDARTISYIEAHGTGTSLGDPIEIAGLVQAFAAEEKQYCALGSVKSNIGHCESAAGIAGLTKVLLQMKHQTLVKSLHSEQLNPHIDFSETPFVVQQENSRWPRPVLNLDGVEREYPRIAGLSSFGAGGSNAHVIVEEYEAEVRAEVSWPLPVVVVLSAKNEERLQEQVAQLLQAIEQEEDEQLADLAYTLQVGREAMEVRLGCLVSTMDQLRTKLRSYLAGEQNIEELYRGELKANKSALSGLAADEDLPQLLDAWIAKGKLWKLVDLWVKGLGFDWSRLYGEVKPRRLSLPTYPFAKERYWVTVNEKSQPETAAAVAVLHPLLQRNTSTLAAQRFSSTFTGEEFFLKDHVVQGQRVLPGAAYLEMARAAVAESLEAGAEAVVQLQDVAFLRPIVVGKAPRTVHIALHPQTPDEVAFEIYTVAESGEYVGQVQGRATLVTADRRPTLDLKAIKVTCDERILSTDDCYEIFSNIDIDYRSSFQSLERIHAGAGQVLAKLRLPTSVVDSAAKYVLHPSLLDGAFQATAGLTHLITDTDHVETRLLFSISSLEILHPCDAETWVWVRASENVSPHEGAQVFDIDLCDLNGRVCVRMRGIHYRLFTEQASIEQQPPATLEGELTLAPVWEVVTPNGGGYWPSAQERVAIVGGEEEQVRWLRHEYPEAQLLAAAGTEALVTGLQSSGPMDHVFWLVPASAGVGLTSEGMVEAQQQGVLTGFRLVKALLAAGYGSRALGLTVVTQQAQAVAGESEVQPAHASVHGLVGSLAKEYGHWRVRLMDLPVGEEWPVAEMLAVAAESRGNALAYRAGQWFRQELVRCELDEATAGAYRQGGVYVIVGGAGGLGEVLSEYLLRRYAAQVVWLGRRALNEEIRQKQERLSQYGPTPYYVTADAADREALQAAYEQIKTRFGKIHGVMLSVVGPLDESLSTMSEERFRSGLAAKVDVSVRVAQVFGAEPLDCALFFSSLGAFEKAGGMSSYAAGCVFQDAFSRALATQWMPAVKVINWGYWGNVGIGDAVPQSFKTRLKLGGSEAIEAAEGMAALERLLVSPLAQVAYLKTSRAEAAQTLGVVAAESMTVTAMAPSVVLAESTALTPPAEANRAGAAAFEEVLGKLLWVQLQELGLFAHAPVVLAQWAERVKLPELYERWLAHSLTVLQEQGYLTLGEAGLMVNQEVEPGAVWAEWAAYREANREGARGAAVALAAATIEALPAILRGERVATEVLFPESSLRLVEGIYKDNPVADYFNEVLGETLVGYVQQRLQQEPEARLRLLEIGAGTGGTSTRMWERLRPYAEQVEEYCYSDISQAFLQHAEREYGPKVPYLRTALFDVEQAVAGQGLEVGGYDVVIATNVLHATRELRATLRNAKALLKGHGVLLLNEMAGSSLFTHLTFGLLPGWWLFADEELRLPGSPAVAPATWGRVLRSEGFKTVRYPAAAWQQLGQQIIVAESDGVVRQAQSAAPAAVRQHLQVEKPRPAQEQIAPAANTDGSFEELLREKATTFLKKLVAQTLRMSPEQLDAYEPLETYGIDSILVVQITNTLRGAFDDISSTLMFEHGTIDALVDHFIATQREALIQHVGLQAQTVRDQIEPETLPELKPIARPGPVARGQFGRFLPTPVRDLAPEPTLVSRNKDIAIVGLSGRYAKSSNVKEFWQRLHDNVNCIREVPNERWDWRKYYGEAKGQWGTIYSKWGGFIDDVDCFDPLFFNISPREAETMDPQERLFLQEAYACIADAGYTPSTLGAGQQVGVFVGVTNGSYRQALYWSIANRVSSLFGFRGPSLAVDTACSSSLTALYLACESLHSGRSEYAIAGGVNLVASPIQYMGLSAMTMISGGNENRAFGAHADGFVDGEGVGAVLLKPLRQAIADGDHIYGVIKGSAINHGGKTNGYTVPNPKAQAEVIREALQESGIDARTISYIEAHGTGTSLGDPIEIAGLVQAFAAEERQYCALGSVKSNIGHCESAAGIAGLTKVLLQLQHQTLVKSLHSEQLNPHIDFSETPFVVQQENSRWPRPVLNLDGVEREYPRIAGLSSFGAGGSNAHVIVEEYEAEARAEVNWPLPVVVVLSAKNEERLQEQVAQLLQAIENEADEQLADLAYTLQVGREAMEVRLGCLVSTMDQLRTKLASYLAGEQNIEELYRGELKANKSALSGLASDEDLPQLLDAWIAKGKLWKLVDLWVKGLGFDWSRLYGEVKPRRLSLPTYPFAKERYWVTVNEKSQPETAAAIATLHPLLQRNTSTLAAQRFSSTFTGEEFFLKDHVVQGQRILPGVAHLEMARAAVQQAVGGRAAETQIRLENVAFLRPLVVGAESREVHIALELLPDGVISFEIYSEVNEVYSQGQAVLVPAGRVEKLDLNTFRTQCTERDIESDECYVRFAQMGLAYGPAFKGLDRVCSAANTNGQILVLGELSLPNLLTDTWNDYVLHPSVMDAALQASLGLVLRRPTTETSENPALPFAIESVEVLSPLSPRASVVVRSNANGNSPGAVQKLDFDIADEHGRVCVKLKGFSYRVVTAAGPVSETSDELTLAPVWEVVTPNGGGYWPSAQERVAIVGGEEEQVRWLRHEYPEAQLFAAAGTEALVAGLQSSGPIDHVFWLVPASAGVELTSEGMVEAQQQGVLTGFRLVKALLAAGYGSRPLGLTVVTQQAQAVAGESEVQPAHASVHGLVGSLAKEYGHWRVRLMDLPAGGEWPVEMLAVEAESRGNALAYRAGQWFRQELVRCELDEATAGAYRQGGVYVIVGGAGGLGEVLSEYLLRHYEAQVVWLGRRALNEEIRQKQERLSQHGPTPYYIAADAADREALQAAYEQIKTRFGKIHGLVNATIVLKDQGLAQMEEASFVASLRAKVDVSVHLAEVFKYEALDFVVFFSALQSMIKAPGQSNYAAGCTFMDAYANALRQTWSIPVKVVNWGFWGSAGVVATDEYRARMAQVGLGSIEAAEGMAALERLLVSPLAQVAYLKTSRAEAAETLGVVAGESMAVTAMAPSVVLAESTALTPPAEANRAGAAAFEEVLGKLLWVQLQELGLFAHAPVTVEQWRETVRLPELYERWLGHSLTVLQEQGYLTLGEAGLMVNKVVEPGAVWAEWAAYQEANREGARGAAVALAAATIEALPAILQGERVATEVLFPESSLRLVEGIYKDNPVADYFNEVLGETLVGYVQQRLQQEPEARLRLLEIGAGTGGTSTRMWERLKPYAEQVAEYCYSDISQAFLQHAERAYGPKVPYLRTALFDVEQAVAAQGLEVGAYDVVIATNVLHATRELRETLRNAKALLKGHGVLLLNEMAGSSLFTHLTFGLLPGWWLFEDEELRLPGSPAVAPATWGQVLRSEGFKTVRYPAAAWQQLGQQIIVAESDGVVRQAQSAAPRQHIHIEKPQFKPEVLPEKKERQSVPIGADALAAHVRLSIRDSISQALKLKQDRIADDAAFSTYGVDSIIAVSLINTINTKLSLSLNTTTLFDYTNVNQLVDHIVSENGAAITAAVEIANPYGEQRDEEVQRPPQLTSSRRRRYVDTREEGQPSPLRVDERAAVRYREDSFEKSTYHRVVIEKPGTVDDLRIVGDGAPSLKDDEVLISVRAFSLNFGDLLCVRGLYPNMPPYPFTPGVEVSGVVVEVGRLVKNVNVGDSVVAMAGAAMAAHATAVVAAASQVFEMPRKLSFEEACALPAVALTMIDAFQKARLRPGEKILIQTATGGIGLIALQLAKHYGAVIYATAGSQSKLDYLRSLGVSNLINYVETDFEKEIDRLTGGTGVDVVINTLSGDAIQKGLSCLSPGGRYVEIAMTALKSAKAVDLSVLNSNQAFFSVDLRRLFSGHPELLSEYWRELVNLVEQGVISPTISRSFPFDRVKDAYHWIEDRKNIGKVVVYIPESYRFETGSTEGTTMLQPEPVAAPAVQADAIAIIGMSGRFAQTDNLKELWQKLAEGSELIEDVSRWTLPPDEPNGQPQCRRGGFLNDIEYFDPLFFNISGLEATYMDPQQRLFLEEAWKALEDAAYVGAGIEGTRCGVYVGYAGGDYQRLFDDNAPAQAFWGNTGSVTAARIAYYLDLQGPTIAIDTACSSSLVAIHLACQALRTRETDLSLAGGVFVQCTPGFFARANRAAMLSPTGHCYTFDARADGFVPGEGVGVVVLKRLTDAINDGDHIYGVIRGSAINQDGATNGITAPSARSQERLEQQVYDTFGIHPEEIQLVEAHGTGTKLGDPIEYRALTQAFARDTSKKAYCAIGSIKTNIGHAAAAAGVAGVIKVLLALKHQQIPATLNYEVGNPHIDFDNSPFYVNTQLKQWDITDGSKRCAAVSSFGMSGTNAHLVIEEPSPRQVSVPAKPAHLIVLSARGAEQLKLQVEQLVAHCQSEPVDCGDMSYTLLQGRRHFTHRLACVARDTKDLVFALNTWLAQGTAPHLYAGAAVELREHGSLQRLGNQCIESCSQAESSDAYWEKLTTIAELYAQGYQLDFKPLFAGYPYRRISLPTYPFAKQRYWVATKDVEAPAVKPGSQKDDSQAEPAIVALSPTYDRLRAFMLHALSEALYVPLEEIDPHKALHEYGLDSLLGLKFMRQLESTFTVTITGREFLDHPTVHELAAFLSERMPPADEPKIPVRKRRNGGDDQLEAFKNGLMDLDEIKTLIEQGVVS